MRILSGLAAATALLCCAGAAHAFDRASGPMGGGAFGGLNRPGGPGFPVMNRPNLPHHGALLGRRWSPLGVYAGAGWPWWGPGWGQAPSVTNVIVNVGTAPSGPPRLPTAADLPVKPGYVTTSGEAPAFVVLSGAATAPAPSVSVVERAEPRTDMVGTARIVRIGDGFTAEATTNPRIIVVSQP
ncbi:hypothetical protein [Alsobacter sp. R-9]